MSHTGTSRRQRGRSRGDLSMMAAVAARLEDETRKNERRLAALDPEWRLAQANAGGRRVGSVP